MVKVITGELPLLRSISSHNRNVSEPLPGKPTNQRAELMVSVFALPKFANFRLPFDASKLFSKTTVQ